MASQGRPKNIPDENVFGPAKSLIPPKDIFEARQIRDAERTDPGIVRATQREEQDG